MSGRGMRYDREHSNAARSTRDTVVGIGSKPPARVPRNILVDPLKTPPMEPVKDADARPQFEEDE